MTNVSDYFQMYLTYEAMKMDSAARSLRTHLLQRMSRKWGAMSGEEKLTVESLWEEMTDAQRRMASRRVLNEDQG